MEEQLKKISKVEWIVFFLGLIYIVRVCFYHFKMIDIPYSDELSLYCAALGKCQKNEAFVYRKILTSFTFFAKDFFHLYFLNYILSFIVFYLLFFFYGVMRDVKAVVVNFLAVVYCLSPINIIATRLYHQWAINLFLAIMIAISILKIRSKLRYFLMGLLTLFRFEFVFGLGLFLIYKNFKGKEYKKIFLIFTVLIFVSLVVLMKYPDWLSLVGKINFGSFYFFTSMYSYANVFHTFKISFLFPVMLLFNYLIRKQDGNFELKLYFNSVRGEVVFWGGIVIPFFFIPQVVLYLPYFSFFIIFILLRQIDYKTEILKTKYLASILFLLFIFPIPTHDQNSKHFYPPSVNKSPELLNFYNKIVVNKDNLKNIYSRQDLTFLFPNSHLIFYPISYNKCLTNSDLEVDLVFEDSELRLEGSKLIDNCNNALKGEYVQDENFVEHKVFIRKELIAKNLVK